MKSVIFVLQCARKADGVTASHILVYDKPEDQISAAWSAFQVPLSPLTEQQAKHGGYAECMHLFDYVKQGLVKFILKEFFASNPENQKQTIGVCIHSHSGDMLLYPNIKTGVSRHGLQTVIELGLPHANVARNSQHPYFNIAATDLPLHARVLGKKQAASQKPVEIKPRHIGIIKKEMDRFREQFTYGLAQMPPGLTNTQAKWYIVNHCVAIILNTTKYNAKHRRQVWSGAVGLNCVDQLQLLLDKPTDQAVKKCLLAVLRKPQPRYQTILALQLLYQQYPVLGGKVPLTCQMMVELFLLHLLEFRSDASSRLAIGPENIRLLTEQCSHGKDHVFAAIQMQNGYLCLDPCTGDVWVMSQQHLFGLDTHRSQTVRFYLAERAEHAGIVGSLALLDKRHAERRLTQFLPDLYHISESSWGVLQDEISDSVKSKRYSPFF